MSTFTCLHCHQVRDEVEDGGVVLKFTFDESGETVAAGICNATDECGDAAFGPDGLTTVTTALIALMNEPSEEMGWATSTTLPRLTG